MTEQDDLPKHQLLLKLLKMTTSDNDGECLVSIRKANGVLRDAGWDWDRLLSGKIKVIGDPFNGVAGPINRGAGDRRPPPPPTFNRPAAAPSAPPRPAPAAPPRPATPPPPPRPKINSTKENIFPGPCYCCGAHVPAKVGYIFDPSKLNPRAKKKWHPVCHTCNQAHYPNIGATPAPKYAPTGRPYTPSASDL